MSETKPREFRLEVENWRTNALSWNNESNELTLGETIHVIEYSAVEALEKRIAALRSALEKSCWCGNNPNDSYPPCAGCNALNADDSLAVKS